MRGTVLWLFIVGMENYGGKKNSHAHWRFLFSISTMKNLKRIPLLFWEMATKHKETEQERCKVKMNKWGERKLESNFSCKIKTKRAGTLGVNLQVLTKFAIQSFQHFYYQSQRSKGWTSVLDIIPGVNQKGHNPHLIFPKNKAFLRFAWIK